MTGTDILLATTAAMTTEAFVQPVARELTRRGHRLHLVCGDRIPEVEVSASTAVVAMNRGMSPTQDLASLRAWVSHLKEIRPRMVVAGTPKASLLALTAARITKVPTRVYVIHGAVWDGSTGVRRRILESAEKATLSASTAQICVSDSLARLIHARGLQSSAPAVVGSGSFCGVDTTRFRPGPSEENRTPTLTFIGRLHRDKGIDALLRVFNAVRQELGARLLVVGGLDTTLPPDDATMRTLTSDPDIEWTGEQPDVLPFLQASDLLLFPTRREGLPQVPLEAQACGVPVVSWRVTGVVDAVRDGFTGTLVPFGDEAALAGAVITLLRDQNTRRVMADNARSWVETRFSESLVAANNADFLESLLSPA
jgi:glycosyltransferase involved in cell wall biosynthesis